MTDDAIRFFGEVLMGVLADEFRAGGGASVGESTPLRRSTDAGRGGCGLSSHP
ncbi:hypothetical protein [Microbacterium sp. SORGH_AS_0421]|uniref:hypothetical protein n=1 Tax=Microbacterium sp. SORGH_AS_0421 TaxID=3041768 RepID=UPI0027909EE1|nr:hypothetical protein [Microbacterium sp. SORGH_AS_0421]MDQ1176453.1 hypothetical protein [Microbacterium sp. SORGH_AS_0421]